MKKKDRRETGSLAGPKEKEPTEDCGDEYKHTDGDREKGESTKKKTGSRRG